MSWGLDAVEATVGAVHHLLQVGRLNRTGPSVRHGRATAIAARASASSTMLCPGLDRLQQCAPQRLADEWRQNAALQRREHPIDARSGGDELAHGRESRRVGFGV